MPLAVAHAIIGASVVTSMRLGSPEGQSRKAVALGVLLAICPDFDVLLLWVGRGWDDWHRGFSHSLVFAVAVGLLVWAGMAVFSLREALMYVSASLSHTASDAVFSKERDGIEFLWPFSAERFSPGFSPYFEFPWALGGGSPLSFLGQFILYSLIELIIFSPLLLLCYANWQRGQQSARVAR
jgi:membrane-bound metal-dependent hydrolase YbcI (DUF457 family)